MVVLETATLVDFFLPQTTQVTNSQINNGNIADMKTAKYGAIFDLDGTLVASEPLFFQATNELLDRYGLSIDDITPEEMATIPGRSALTNMIFYKQKFGLLESPQELVDMRMTRVLELLRSSGVVMLPGAMELVQALHTDGFALAIASSSPRPYVPEVLEFTGLYPYFQVVVTGSDVTRHKPDPEIFERARTALGILKEHCVVFEDAHSGIEAAKTAHIPVIAIDNPITLPHQLALADHLVPTFVGLGPSDVISVINACNGA